MRNGSLYPPLKSGHPTDGSASSSSPGLLPTPRPQAKGGGSVPETELGGTRPSGTKRALNLATVTAHLLRTPTAQLAANGGSQHPEKRKAGGHGPTLADEIEHLLPTPAAHDSANTPENHLRKKPGRSQVTSLQIVVDYGLLPTGGRMPSPCADGNTPPDAPLQGQLSLGGLESD